MPQPADPRQADPALEDALNLGAILGRIRGELVELGRCADGLQATISAIVAGSATPLDLDAQVDLQAADALSQRLERLAHLAAALEAGVRDGRTDPASDASITHALSRLTGAGGLSGAPAYADDGDCELF